MLTILIFFNALFGFALTAATYASHKSGQIKEALVAIGLLTLTIANIIYLA